MKKLLLVAMLFTGTIVFANSGNVTAIEKVNDVKTVVVDLNTSKINTAEVVFDACGDLGNVVYDHARSEGANHRTARAIRRQFVRGCRANQ